MEYPARLLPHPEYGVFSADDLQRTWMVIRRTSVDAPSQLVAPESLSQYLGMSVSLCGTFRPEDVKLVPHLTPDAPVDGVDNEWFPGNRCIKAEHIACTIDHQRHPTLLPVELWHRTSFPIVKGAPQGRATQPLQGLVEIEHRPTNVNYWHCEITFKQQDGTRILSAKKTWQRNAISFVISSLSRPGRIVTDLASVKCTPIAPPLRDDRESMGDVQQ